MSVAPAGYTTAAPWIVTRDTRKLFQFITDVFDGVELGQLPLEDGSIGHAEIRVGDTSCSPSTTGRAGRTSLPCSGYSSPTPMQPPKPH